jgi:helicase domain protein
MRHYKKRLEKNATELKTLQEANATLKEWSENNQTYPKQELFNRLLKDLEICNAENDKMTFNRQYKSEWRSGALEEYKNWDKTQKAKMLKKLKEQNSQIQTKTQTQQSQNQTLVKFFSQRIFGKFSIKAIAAMKKLWR